MTKPRDTSPNMTGSVETKGCPRLSIIVCTYNRVNLLAEALNALVVQTLDNRLYEVIVINNNSTDNTQKVAEEFSERHANTRVFIETEQGLSHARNRGWREAQGEFVAYIDDDAKASPEWCEKILHAFETNEPKPTAVGGRILPWHECEPPTWFSDELEIRTWGEDPHYLQDPKRYSGFSGSNMAFPRTVLERYGGFSSQHGMVGKKMRFGEETDLFIRINDEEKRFWYDPEIVVFHYVPRQNLHLSYYVKRGFLNGLASSRLEKINFFSRRFVKVASNFFEVLLSIPVSLIKAREKHMNLLVIRLKRLGFLTGKMLGVFM